MRKNSLLFSIIFHAALILIAVIIVVNHSSEYSDWVTVEFGSFSNSINHTRQKTDKTQRDKRDFPKSINNGKGDLAPEKFSSEDSLLSERLKEDSVLTKYGNGKFEIDFQGRRERTIYNYTIPTYPPGAEKEVDLIFQVTIAPDGTVENVFPLAKGDTRLEVASINALTKWRFEPLPKNMPQVKQNIIVVFPYRLR